MRIDYINALAGSGKTYGIASWAADEVRKDRKIILVQPTALLIGETVLTTFPRQGVPAEVVTVVTAQTTPPGGVIARIIAHMRGADPNRGEILVITHAAFVLLSQQYVHGRENWTVVVDEVLDVHAAHQMNLPNTHEILTQHLEITDATNTEYWQVGKRPGSTMLDMIAENSKQDEVYGRFFQAFAGRVLSPDWQVFVQASSFMALKAEIDVPGIKRQLVASAVLRPTIFEGFRRVIIMSACFEESLMYMLWSRMPTINVEFRDVTSMIKLRYREHVNGDCLDIHYAIDGSWSKTARGRTVRTLDGDEVELFDGIRAAARGLLGDASRCAYLVNNDVGDDADETAERLPAFSHGLNTYQHLHNAVLLIAINPPPGHFGFLQRFADIEAEDIRSAMYRACVYQAAMRISLRDPECRVARKLVVPDRATAEWLSVMFPGSRVHDLGVFETGNPRKRRADRMYESSAERQAAYRKRVAYAAPILLDRELRVKLVNGYGIANKRTARAVELTESMTETPNLLLTTIDHRFQGSFHPADVTVAAPVSHFADSFDELVSIFRESSEERHAAKGDCLLWGPAHFVDRVGGHARAYANIAYCRHVVLDNDGGDLTPEQFAMSFPGLRMVLYSTWSSSRDCLKWRVLIPTGHLVDIEGYKLLTGHIIARLNDHGWFAAREFERDPDLALTANGTHGFDVSKLNPSNILYLPSRGAHPEDAFFIDMSGAPRAPIPVFEWLKSIAVPPEPPALPPPPPPRTANPKASAKLQALQTALLGKDEIRLREGRDRRVDAALERWRTEGDLPGRRDEGWWRLACDLSLAGVDEAEYRATMRAAADASTAGDRGALKAKVTRMWARARRTA